MASAEFRFDLKPEAAMRFLRSKGYALSFDWRDTYQEEHDSAFTVAKMMNLDLLRDVREAVDRALAEGETFQQFREAIEGRLVQAGWWGRGEMRDPASGELREVQLGSPRRLRTIFRTNLQTAYAAGHWEQIQEAKQDAPLLMYDAVDDGLTRPEHAAWDGVILPVDDPWWHTHMPPNGWNCRCGVIQLSAGQAAEMGYLPADTAPASPTRSYTNPRTGEVTELPEGIDPGWAYNPGASRLQLLEQQLAAKERAFRADDGGAA
jgi:SPP1 gp7 family putative phage head morphogenesis protein